MGHDSHGVIHIPEYVARVDKGHIVPGAPFVVEREAPCTAVINGNWGFGFVVTERAMEMAIEKAKTHGVAAITIHYQSHIGRLGDYSAMALREGMIGLITADSGAGAQSGGFPLGAPDAAWEQIRSVSACRVTWKAPYYWTWPPAPWLKGKSPWPAIGERQCRPVG